MRLIILPLSFLTMAFASPKDSDECVTCHGNVPATAAPNSDLEPPQLPQTYSMDWDMFEFSSDARPPVESIPKANQQIHGKTYYDWTRQSMTEVYQERCIDIFPAGREFPCQFTSIKDRTYFVRFSTTTKNQPESCCLWRDTAFWAPRPDVLRNMIFDRDMRYGNKNTRWWTLDVPLPGPFGYGVADGRPTAFWFPVISGWVQQVFHHFSTRQPSADAFALPAVCQSKILPICEQ